MPRTVWVWTGVTAGLVIAALGVLFAALRLDNADKSASVIGALVSVAGLAMTIATTITNRHSGSRTPTGQSADDVSAQDVLLIDGAARVRAGQPKTDHPFWPAPDRRRSEAGPQQVRGVRAAGDVRMIRNVDGDVDLP